jgi:O-antigen/teichoic acid export membrane protein
VADLHRAARGGAVNLLGMVAGGILQFVLVVLVTHLGAKGAGVVFEAVAIFMILTNVTEFGADTGLVRLIPHALSRDRRAEVRPLIEAAVVPVLVLGILVMVATLVWAPELASIFFHGVENTVVVRYLRILAPFIPLAGATTILLAATRGFGTMVPYVLVQNVGLPAARPVLVVIGWLAGLGAVAVAVGWVVPIPVGFAVAAVIALSMVRRVEGTRHGADRPLRSRQAISSEFWRFAGPRGLAAAFGITVTWLDILLVGALRSTAEAGVYAAVSRLALLGVLVLQAVGMAIAPHVSGLISRRRHDDAESLYQVATWWLIALTWPFYLSVAMFAPLILRIFGVGFVPGAPALVILSLGMLFNLGTGNVTTFLLMAGRSSWHLINTALSLTINVGLNLALIPRYGMTGAAIAWTASIIAVNLAALLEVWWFLDLRPFGRGYPIVALGSVVCYGSVGIATRAVAGLGYASAIAALMVSTACFGLILWRYRRALQLDLLLRAFRAETRTGTSAHLAMTNGRIFGSTGREAAG